MDDSEVTKFYKLIAECGEDAVGQAQSLINAGFSAFLPRDAFRRSFCLDKAQEQTHRAVSIELAKVALARPVPARATLGVDSFYHSAELDRLVHARDKENGFPGSELRSRAGDERWKIEIDPCMRQLARRRFEDRSGFDASWASVRRNEAATLAKEVALHSSGLSHSYSFTASGRCEFYVAVMKRDADSLGFALDYEKSSPNFPIFSMRTACGLDLCWVIEEIDRFVMGHGEGDFRPTLELRYPAHAGPALNATSRDFLVISYSEVIRDFAQAYCTFRNLDELEVIIKAHLRLYQAIAPTITEAVHQAFVR
jgi:hypothetical protein